jgi:hypothetical protein
MSLMLLVVFNLKKFKKFVRKNNKIRTPLRTIIAYFKALFLGVALVF